jgi:hypothetical protein
MKRHENWLMKIFEKVASEKNFPNDEIIQLYLRENHGCCKGNFVKKLVFSVNKY